MPETPTPTAAELAILQVLWERGSSTVREVFNALAHERGTGYSTTLKLMQLMVEKGLLVKDETQRPQMFWPAQPQEQMQMRLLDALIQRAFGGSAANLVLRIASAKRISSEELAQIRKLIDRSKKEQP
jgi:BlaI family transcriptional regulator, penicillinase repressor